MASFSCRLLIQDFDIFHSQWRKVSGEFNRAFRKIIRHSVTRLILRRSFKKILASSSVLDGAGKNAPASTSAFPVGRITAEQDTTTPNVVASAKEACSRIVTRCIKRDDCWERDECGGARARSRGGRSPPVSHRTERRERKAGGNARQETVISGSTSRAIDKRPCRRLQAELHLPDK